ncbi:tRNA-dihydrouridine synthase [Methylococcus sp. EFPC2]|uniref:tRNA dihydrouridine synthase n=1 Tax=Methylococcus sp. EFPC2 TaxID=2812648 RepID=UPI00196770B7|nr:tRNA-dihydrouridine synthase [Methylococcus sp. EFPC2]QSA98915.1 tRNA-dihydrouridine synthase [Methylococcus sp. EFPC2]
MRIYLAPMEGLLDHILRDVLTRLGGVDICVTEFLRVSGSLQPPRSFLRIAPELENGSLTHSGVPVRVQLLGSDPHFMAQNAARLATLKPTGIDLNFGCPAKTVNRHQGGAILLREPERLYAVVSAVRAAIPPDMLLSAKMRLGYDDPHRAVDCARAIRAGGAGELVVHARTKEDGYRPPAYWERIAPIKAAVNIPVVANGEIWTAEDYQRCRDISGVDDAMLGRGAVANPGLARTIKHGQDARVSWSELQPLLLEFWRLVGRHVQVKYRCGRMKQWLNYLRRTYPEAERAYQNLRTVVDPLDLERKLFGACLPRLEIAVDPV